MDTDPIRPHRIDPEHMSSSTSRIEALCRIVNRPKGSSILADRISIGIGHYDHGGFLSAQLRGFAVFEIDSSQRLSLIDGSGSVLYALSPRQSVESQLESVLAFLANLIDRQSFSRKLRDSPDTPLDNIYDRTQEVDRDSSTFLSDQLRAQDWKRSALSIRDRAEASGISLHLELRSPLLNADQLRNRTPVMRYVYNKMELVRHAIDKIAHAVPNSMRLEGPGVSQEVMHRAQQGLESADIARYTSHVFRDAYVCGNGYLEFTSQPAVRLLRPEDVEIKAKNYFLRNQESTTQIKSPVMHLPGAGQSGSSYGASMLEPFVQMLLPVDTAEHAIKEVESAPQSLEREHALSRFRAHYERAQKAMVERERNVLSSAMSSIRDFSSVLYFPGFEQLPTTVKTLSFDS